MLLVVKVHFSEGEFKVVSLTRLLSLFKSFKNPKVDANSTE